MRWSSPPPTRKGGGIVPGVDPGPHQREERLDVLGLAALPAVDAYNNMMPLQGPPRDIICRVPLAYADMHIIRLETLNGRRKCENSY